MPKNNQKQGRLAEDLRREIVDIVAGLKDPRLKKGLLTITRVDVTQDLDVAKVYVSVLGEGDDALDKALAALTHASGHVRTEVSRRMHIRKAPALRFVGDKGAQYAEHINKLLENL